VIGRIAVDMLDRALVEYGQYHSFSSRNRRALREMLIRTKEGI
jgi:Arc/MetJ-type ribon-helix-helix transcriptional regulator